MQLSVRIFNPEASIDYAMWKQLALQWLEGYDHELGVIPYLTSDVAMELFL